MSWTFPVEFREIPLGGHFLSDWYIDAAGRRQARALRHSGVDMAPGHPGAPIVVIGPGTVCRVSETSGGGWGFYFYIDHGQVDAEGRHAYSFGAHMQGRALFNVGDLVDGGTLAGHVGKTGTQASGNHLHWGVAVCFPHEFDTLFAMGSAARGLLVDPIAFVEARLDPLEPGERQVLATSPLNVREHASKDSAEVGELAAGRQFRPDWFERGVPHEGVAEWFHVPADGARPAGYVWAGGTTDPGTHDIPDRTPAPAPVEPAGETGAPAEESPAPPKPSGRRRATRSMTDAELAALLATRGPVPVPSESIIPDAVARPLWIVLSLLTVSIPPVFALTLIDWVDWGPEVATQSSATIVGWLGSIAAVLGLSRYAKSKPAASE